VPVRGHLVRMAVVPAVRAKQEEMRGVVVAAEEAIVHRVEREEVSAVRRARGRGIGVMAVTLVGLTPIVVQTVVLLAVGDKVVLVGDVVDQPGQVQDAQVLPAPETRDGLSVTMIGGTAEVVAKMADAGRIGEMTRALRHEGASDGEMTDVLVREITAGVMTVVEEADIEATVMAVVEGLDARNVLNGRNGRAKIAGRHAKNVKHVSHETKRNAEPLRCAHAVVGQLASGSSQPSAKNILINGSTRVPFEKKSSR